MLKSETIKAALAELAESRLQLDIQESELRTQLKHAELQEARLRFRDSEELIRRQNYQLEELWPSVSVNRQGPWTTALSFDQGLYKALLNQGRDWGTTLWFAKYLAEKLWPVLRAIPLQIFWDGLRDVYFPDGYDLLTGYFHTLKGSAEDEAFDPFCRTVYLAIDDRQDNWLRDVCGRPVDPKNFERHLRFIGGNHDPRPGVLPLERAVEWELNLTAEVTNGRQSNVFKFSLPSVDRIETPLLERVALMRQ